MIQELLKFCRYYNGGNKPPKSHAELWDYERKWLELNVSQEGKELLADYIDEYSRAGLSQFEAQDDTPASLKALLFYRFCYGSSGSMIENVEPFKRWYTEIYINGGS